MNDFKCLLALHNEMSRALERRDWSCLDTVNEALSHCLAQITTPVSAEVAALQVRLQLLCERVLVTCREEHGNLRDRLQRHRDSAEGLAAYEQASTASGVADDV